MRHAHAVWRTGIRDELAPCAGVHPRTVDHWESGARAISTEAFLALLESDQDLAVLDIFMSRLRPDLRQRWLDQQALLAKLERAERKQAQLEQASRQLRLELKR